MLIISLFKYFIPECQGLRSIMPNHNIESLKIIFRETARAKCKTLLDFS